MGTRGARGRACVALAAIGAAWAPAAALAQGPRPVPAPLLASGDEDRDGVRNDADVCPVTARRSRPLIQGCSGIEVLARGTVLPERAINGFDGLRSSLRAVARLRDGRARGGFRSAGVSFRAASRSLVGGDACAAAEASREAASDARGGARSLAGAVRAARRRILSRRTAGGDVGAPDVAYHDLAASRDDGRAAARQAGTLSARLGALCDTVSRREVVLRGVVRSVDSRGGTLRLGGRRVHVDGARARGVLAPGSRITVRGLQHRDGTLVAETIVGGIPKPPPGDLSTCTELLLVPRQGAATGESSGLHRHELGGYTRNGTLLLETGMGVAAAPRGQLCPTAAADERTYRYGIQVTLTYKDPDGVQHTDEVLAHDVSADNHRPFVIPRTNSQLATMRVTEHRVACKFTFEEEPCLQPELLATHVHSVRVRQAGGYALLDLDGGSGHQFVVADGIPGAFDKDATVGGFQNFTSEDLEAFVQVFGRGVQGGEATAEVTDLFIGERIAIIDDRYGGIEYARVIGGRNGLPYFYDAFRPKLVTDGVRNCSDVQKPVTFYRMPWVQKSDDERITQGNNNSDGTHKGSQKFAFDFKLEEGEPIHALRGGEVTHVEESLTANSDPGAVKAGDEPFAPANALHIRHRDGSVGKYFHMPKNGVFVSEGDIVHRGEKVAKVGNTGNSSGPHLHFHVTPEGGGPAVKLQIEYRREGQTTIFHCGTPFKDSGYITTNRVP